MVRLYHDGRLSAGHHIRAGRVPWGAPYAHVVYGSVVKASFYGLTTGHAVRRALCWAAKDDLYNGLVGRRR